MVQLLRSLRRMTTSEGAEGAPEASGADHGQSRGARLPSTVEQLDAAATLIEGLGQLRQISLRQGEAPSARPDNRASQAAEPAAPRAPWRRAFALQAWMEENAEKARRRSGRGLMQRLERALAPLAYPG